MPLRSRRRPDFDAQARIPTYLAAGRELSPFEDVYIWILTRSWLAFFATVAVAFALVNVAFAGLYSLEPGAIHGASSFEDRVYFSVQTLGTIGYGVMYPETRRGNLLVSVEALVGLLFVALVTGLTFARFARPTSRILFTEKAVIAPRNGVPHLMFRIANFRRNQIAEATLHALLLVPETTTEGDVTRLLHPLPLLSHSNPTFLHSWTAMHRIDETSPFHGEGALARLKENGVELYVTLTGTDETLAQTLHARVRYTLGDIVPNARFADMLHVTPDGTRIIDYDRFNEIRPIES